MVVAAEHLRKSMLFHKEVFVLFIIYIRNFKVLFSLTELESLPNCSKEVVLARDKANAKMCM